MGNTENDRERIYKLAYDEGMNGLRGQESTLSTIRQRAVSLGAISGLVATFLGKEALQSVPLNSSVCAWRAIPQWAGLISLILSILLILDILKPRDGWIFHHSANSIIDQFGEGENAQPIGITYKILAQFSEDNYAKNDEQLKKLFNRFSIAVLLVLIQIIGWLIALQ